MLFLPFSQVIAIYTKVMVNAAKTSLCKETQGKLCTRSCRWVIFILSKPVLVAHTFAHSGKSMQKRIYADRCGSSDAVPYASKHCPPATSPTSPVYKF